MANPRSKYRNQRVTDADGITHDSKKEMRRWRVLQLAEQSGVISDLRRQVRYNLHVVGGPKLWAYVADFVYRDEAGAVVVEDVKSPATRKLPVYRAKRLHMRLEHGIEIREV